tara:strand:+ start:176 stop:1579 length:1404 start_codon:yes stop_codon:yes gene_type:complete
MKNLHLYFPEDLYNELKGGDWPDYSKFLNGDRGPNTEIKTEINGYIDMYVKDGILFPIKTATACQSKWTWSTLYLNQLSTASCHRVEPDPFKLEDFDDLHNTPRKIREREMMLEGKWPGKGCEYCRDVEEVGGHSDRMHNLEIRNLTPPELETDPTATSVTPRILEIFAQNTCNLSCTYCNSNLSSKIQQENNRFGAFDKDGVTIPIVAVEDSTKEYFDRFFVYLEKNISQLKRLHLLGGETFIQHKLMNNVLDLLEKQPSPELELCVFSNMNAPERWWNTYIERFKQLQHRGHIRYFDLTASIDCWGPEAKYARTGLDLELLEKRLAWASEQGDWLRLNVNQTVTCLTMTSMSGLAAKVAEYSKHRHIGHYFQFYTGLHMFQHPKTFAWSLWEPYMQELTDAMPKETMAQWEAITRMNGMLELLKNHTHHNYKDINQLHTYLDELDRRRNTDWRSIYPMLDLHDNI